MCVKYPELINRLTLCNSPIGDSWPVLPVKIFKWIAQAGLYPVFANTGLVLNPLTNKKIKQAFYNSEVLSKEKTRQIFWAGKLHTKEGQLQFARHLKAINNKETLEILDDLKSLKTPIQLIWGKSDHYQPWRTVGQKFMQRFPGSSSTVIPQSGHYTPLEKPGEVINAMLTWHDSL
jgi:pimeloyl-ACP methyl ester carboxylesterase